MLLWPLSTSLKHHLIPPSLQLYPSIFHSIPLSSCLPLHPYLPSWLHLPLLSSITLAYIHPSFDLCPSSHSCFHEVVYKALNLRDYLHRFTLPSLTLFSSLHASFILYSSFLNFISTICTLSLLLPTFLFFYRFHLLIHPAVYLWVNNPLVWGRIAGQIEKTHSFLFTFSEVIYALMWRVFLGPKGFGQKAYWGKSTSFWMWGRASSHNTQRFKH